MFPKFAYPLKQLKRFPYVPILYTPCDILCNTKTKVLLNFPFFSVKSKEDVDCLMKQNSNVYFILISTYNHQFDYAFWDSSAFCESNMAVIA